MVLNVYYLDDEEMLCEIFSDTYESPIIKIRTFQNPSEAIQVAERTPPDVFFIDYRMPGFNGEQVAKSLSGKYYKYLVTGDLQVQNEFKFDGIIHKPYSPSVIQNILDHLLKKKSS